MSRWVVDTNVPVVANGRNDDDGRPVAPSCRESAVRFLLETDEAGRVLVDTAGEMQGEYRRRLNPSGQPGTGDQFFRSILDRGRRIEWIDLGRDAAGEYVDLPAGIADSEFDRSDRKFAAMSVKEGVPVANVTDSDWADCKELLESNGVEIRFLCGCDPAAWRGPPDADDPEQFRRVPARKRRG